MGFLFTLKSSSKNNRHSVDNSNGSGGLFMFFVLVYGASCPLKTDLYFVKKEYPAKIIIAWTEAVAGNGKIRDWLTQNGYPELGLFCFALTNRDSAREWLMKNDHPHLMALIRGAEGDPNALLWLKKYKFDVLEKVARGGDNDDQSINWLINKNLKDFANLSLRIRAVKNAIEDDNQDVHKFNID